MTTVAAGAAPAIAADIFGERLVLAARYANWLLGPGVERGLVGPREADRVWSRHILNCAAAAAVIAPGSRAVDIGAGAGLPGVVLAIARPDVDVILVEAMLRRAAFLEEVVADLGLGNVTIKRARAEELRQQALDADVVTARAVASMERLAGWAAPLLRPDGRVVAIKGDAVTAEVSAAWRALRRARLTDARLIAIRPAHRLGRPAGQAVHPAQPVPAGLGGSWVPALVVEDCGRWDGEAAGAPFVSADGTTTPCVGGETATDERQPPAGDRLALIAVLRRTNAGLSPASRREAGLV